MKIIQNTKRKFMLRCFYKLSKDGEKFEINYIDLLHNDGTLIKGYYNKSQIEDSPNAATKSIIKFMTLMLSGKTPALIGTKIDGELVIGEYKP